MHEPKQHKRPRNARFPCLISVSVPQRHADALEWLAKHSLLTTSDHVRLALDQYLHDTGVLASLEAFTERAMNGNGVDHQRKEAEHGRG